MRQAMSSSATASSTSRSIAAPVGGWNARDPLAAMPARDALYMDNIFPRTGDVMVRKGSRDFASLPEDIPASAPHNIRSLMSYSPQAGVPKLFAGDNTGIYDVTAGGAVAVPVSPALNGEWQSLNIATAGGSFLWCCNGVDSARYFDGTSWTVLSTTSTPPLTGIVPTDIVNISLFKTRPILLCNNSLSFWFLPVVSIAGAASEFPLGSIFKKGGYLVATDSWSLDAGTGPDDYLIAITSEGEVAVYKGTDPSNAANFALVGVFDVGKPLSRRCFVKLGGDLGILTVKGLYPLSKALLSASIDRRVAFSDKIDSAFVLYAEGPQSLFGWQVLLFSEAPFVLVNVPILANHAEGVMYSYQFVMNTITGAWCRFTSMQAECWAVHAGKLYFACHNKVSQAWVGEDDSGAPIDCRVKTAYQYPFGSGSLGRITMIRPLLTASAPPKLHISLDTDYDESILTAPTVTRSSSTARWDVDKWDEAVWASLKTTSAQWRSVSHKPGRAVSVLLRGLLKGVSMSWNATDMILQRGGMM